MSTVKPILQSLMAAGHTRKQARDILNRAKRATVSDVLPGNPDAHQVSRQVARAQKRVETSPLGYSNTSGIYKAQELKLINVKRKANKRQQRLVAQGNY